MFKIAKMDFLVSLYTFCIVASELMGGKTFPLGTVLGFKLNASVAIFLLPIVFTINDVIAEVFGKERARSVVRSGLFTVFLVFLACVAFTNLPPSMRFMVTEKSYDTIFGLSARIALASLTAFALAEFMDVYVFTSLKQQFGNKKLWLRNNVSNFIAQLFDTAVFMIIAFWAMDKGVNANVSFLISLILPYWLLKCAMSIFETPFVYLGVNWLKNEKKV